METIIPQVKPMEWKPLFHRLNPWNGKTIIPQVKPVEWHIHYSTG